MTKRAKCASDDSGPHLRRGLPYYPSSGRLSVEQEKVRWRATPIGVVNDQG